MPDIDKTVRPPIQVRWAGSALDPSGYGEATRNYVIGLDKLGVDVRLTPLSFWKEPAGIGQVAKDVNRLSKVRPDVEGARKILAYNLTAELWGIDPLADVHVAVTTWETDGVPKQWLLPLRAMDHVVVFSEFNRGTFTAAGARNVHVVPHGVDCARFNPGVEPMFQKRDGVFSFGMNIDWNERKCPLEALRAYFTAFGKNDGVALILKAGARGEKGGAETLARAVEMCRRETGKSRAETAPVYMVSSVLPGEDMPSFYTSLDCLLAPSHCEGWNLCASEAMAAGVPVVATDWGGNTEYMTKDNSWLLDYKLVDIRPANAPNLPLYHGQKWAEPSFDHLVETMLEARANPAAARERGKRARISMESLWTWDMACVKMRDFLLSV
jgi:glycosyltransferase involved in cell wall biosynthesis